MQQKTKNEIMSWIKSICFAFIIVLVCRQFLFAPVVVQGESMFPTLTDNNKLIVTKTTPLERFDLIVFNAPDEEQQYVKRIIGIPGDSVEVKDDVLYVNGKPYSEPYVNTEVDGRQVEPKTNDFTLQEITDNSVVPDDHYFVLGDNRTRSNDSRAFGFITDDLVVGEAKFRFYPFNDVGVMN
ncbi:signal peptidase I [Aquibacillus sediminis]|uniref:signal peptidase I n=1 Tax=Aquibacillus sediminis TaxID=2574734 RepID=UPI001109F15B|nr:signal peptidase I [Aquibacillus sediminis]